MIHFVVPADGAFTLTDYLERDLPEMSRRMRVIRYEDLPGMQEFPRGTWVWSGLDQLLPGMLRLVTAVHGRLEAAGGGRFLNHPTWTLLRFELLDLLHRSGRNSFRAVRAGGNLRGLRYPVFLRGERSHDGNFSSLLHTPGDVEQAIGKAVIQGHDLGDLMVIEFCPVADPDGFYRKYAAFKVGDRIIPRSLQHGRHWMVKFADSAFTRALVMEEKEYMTRNPHGAELAELFRLAEVEYGQIDYSFQDGRMQTWEINLNPTIGRGAGPSGGVGPVELRPIRDEAREYFFDRFREAWREVDLEPGEQAPVRAELDRELIRGAQPHRGLGSKILAAGRALVRPVKPVVEPLTAPFVRLLGKAAAKVRRRRS